MPIRFPQMHSLMTLDGSIPIRVTWTLRRLCVRHSDRDSEDKELRFILHSKISSSIPRTEAALKVKLSRKLLNKKRAKKQLAGLYEVLKPGSYVTKSSSTTTIINEPGRSPVKVRDNDLAKFGTKAERATNLWTNAQRRPAPYEQTTETKIATHSNVKKQKRGEVKIRHRQRDTTSLVSSVDSNVTRALTVRKSQPKLRRTTASVNEPSEPTTHEQPGTSLVPAPPLPTTQKQPGWSLVSASQAQNEGRKRKQTQFYNFSEADISPTSALASSSSPKTKKRKTKKQDKRSTATEESVLALIRMLSSPEFHLHQGPIYRSDKFHHTIPESDIMNMSKREMSEWDAENEI